MVIGARDSETSSEIQTSQFAGFLLEENFAQIEDCREWLCVLLYEGTKGGQKT